MAMKCPYCNSKKIYVTNTRSKDGWIYRRRCCRECNHLFTTYEILPGTKPPEQWDKNRIISAVVDAINKVI